MSQDNEHIINGSLDDDQIMIYTHGIRKKIVSGMTEGGKIPSDTREIQALAGVLNDMDRAAISIKKIKSDEKVADTANANGAALVARLLKELSPTAIRNSNFVDIVPPTLGNDIVKPELKPGETDIGTSNLTFDEFSKVHFKSNE